MYTFLLQYYILLAITIFILLVKEIKVFWISNFWILNFCYNCWPHPSIYNAVTSAFRVPCSAFRLTRNGNFSEVHYHIHNVSLICTIKRCFVFHSTSRYDNDMSMIVHIDADSVRCWSESGRLKAERHHMAISIVPIG